MHGATQGQGMRMSLAPASTTSLVNPAHRSSSANLHISTSSALVPRRTPLQQQPAQQPIVVVQAAKTTTHQVETKDAAPKKKRAPRKKKGPSDDDAPKQRKAARSIKRTDADAAFLQLLPEDNLEQLQDQLQDEMEAMVERKGGGLLTRTKKKTVPSTVAPVEDAVMDAAETPATPPVAAELFGADQHDGGTFAADVEPQWYGIRVSENYGKRVGMWIEDTVRLRMPIAYLADGREVERPCKTWIPEKTIKAFNHRMGSKKLQYQQGGVVLVKTIMDRDLASVLESSTFTHGWINQDMQSVSEPVDSTRTGGRARQRAGQTQVVTLPKACTRRFMASIDTWLELDEDETEEEAKEGRYGGLPGPITRESTRIEDQQERVEVYTVDDGSGGVRKVVKYKSDSYRGTFNNPSRWFDPSTADSNGTWQGSAGDDDEEFSLSLVSYDPPRRRKRDQGERSAKHIKHNFYHGPDEGFVDSAPRPETSRDEQEARWNPTSNNEDSGFRGDRRGANASTGRRGGASGVEPVVGWREEDDDLGDDAWQKGWEQWDSSPADADASVVDAPSVGGRQQGAGAEDWRGSAAGTVGDEVDALLEELQSAFSDVPAAPTPATASSSEDEDWGWFLAELDGSDSAEMPTHTSSSKAGGLLDPLPGPTDPIAQDSAGQDDWLDALFADPEKNDSPAPRRRMRAGVELDDDTSPASMRQRRDKSGPWGPAQDAGSPAPPGLPEGAPVEVTEGPWRGFTGSVLRGAGRQRVALQLDVFGKMTEAEVDVAHCRGLAE